MRAKHGPGSLHTQCEGPEKQPLKQPGCNCQAGPAACPVQGKCLTESVVYRATVTETASGNREMYTGMTGNTFKALWNGHNSDMRLTSGRRKTKLSTHAWSLKDSNTDFDVDWYFIERATILTQ